MVDYLNLNLMHELHSYKNFTSYNNYFSSCKYHQTNPTFEHKQKHAIFLTFNHIFTSDSKINAFENIDPNPT